MSQELRDQSVAVHRLARHYDEHIPAGWVPPHSDRFGASSPYEQLVTAHGAGLDFGGRPRAPAGGRRRGCGRRRAARLYYSETTLGGVRAMVLTTPLAPGLALQVAAPLNTVDTEVTSVGATLALLSAIGVALAALAGWGVARAGLAPVGRLAAVAEQVTTTGDPASRVEVDRADELGRLATSFNTMLNALQRSLAAQRQLVSDASHELRTPLTSLQINAELLAGDPGLSGAERQEVLDRVVAQVGELGQLVANVTELARGEPVTSAFGDVRLDEVVAAGLEGARRDWPQTPFTADLEPCVVFGSAGRLQIAVRNLLDNAAKFGPPGAPVEVRLLGGELTVRDRGAGIAPADLPHVFDRFYRAASARAVPGSGLGLSIVRQVAEGHGGSVRAESADGEGTLIRLRLPGSASPDRGRPPERVGAERVGAERVGAAQIGAGQADAATAAGPGR